MKTGQEEEPLYCCSLPYSIEMERRAFHYACEMLSDDAAEHIEANVRLFTKDYAVEVGLVTEGYLDSDGRMLLAHFQDDKTFSERLGRVTDNIAHLRDRDLSDMCRRIAREDVTALADTRAYVAMRCDELDMMFETITQSYAEEIVA